jgi:ABC-type glycerol-3-phosphate transport system permease component
VVKAAVRSSAWLIVLSALLIPVVLMISGSFADLLTLWGGPRLIPRHPTLINYERLLSARGTAGGQSWELGGTLLVPRWVLNTVALTVIATVVSIYTSASAGYALRSRGGLGLLVVTASLIVPSGALIIPLFRVARGLGIQGTLVAAALPQIYWPLGILLYRAYLRTFDADVVDAARIEGASELTIFTRIVLPATTPALGAMALLKALDILGDFVWQWVQLGRSLSHTLLVGLARMTALQTPAYGLPNPAGMQMAAGALSLIPAVLVFLALKRFWREGIETGALR